MSSEVEQRKLVRTSIEDLTPYAPVESPESLAERLGMPLDMILKLDSNENPYGASISVQEALGSFDRYHHYPDAQASRLRQRLSVYAGVKPEAIVIGNGSDELIDLILLTILDPGDEVIIPEPTFGVYRARTELFRGVARIVPRTDRFDLDVEAMIDAVSDRTKAMILTSPNNPTGNLTPTSDIVQLLDTGVLVIVDEAYYEFCGKTAMPLTQEFDNLVVLRTFSKWAGLAGMRIGYGVFPDHIAAQIWKVKAPFNVSAAALQAAEASLDDIEYLHLSINRIRNETRRMTRMLATIDYLKPYPSVANFVLCKVTGEDAHDIHLWLADRGIMIRKYGGELRNYLRFSTGRPEDTNRLMTALQRIGDRD
ncbi:MAG: histidinol-phosphate transaminase [Thermomicrobiales bacterium]